MGMREHGPRTAPRRADAAWRGRHLILFDVAATCASFLLSLALRFDAPSPQFDLYLAAYIWLLPILIISRVAAFVFLRLYRRVWRYASVEGLFAIVCGVLASSIATYGSAFLFLMTTGRNQLGFPRSVPVIETLLVIALAGGWRVSLPLAGNPPPPAPAQGPW